MCLYVSLVVTKRLYRSLCLLVCLLAKPFSSSLDYYVMCFFIFWLEISQISFILRRSGIPMRSCCPSIAWSVHSLITPFVLSVVLLVLLLLLLLLLLWSYDQRNCLIPLNSSVFSARGNRTAGTLTLEMGVECSGHSAEARNGAGMEPRARRSTKGVILYGNSSVHSLCLSV